MSEPPPDQRPPRPSSDNPAADHVNRVAAAFETYSSNQKAADAKHAKHNRKIRRWTRVATVGAIVYTLVTGAILIATIRSIHEARRAVRTASRAADAATRQAEIAEDTEKRQLRPYVGTIPGMVENFGDPGRQRFTLTVENFGNTPAYDVGSLISYNGVYKNISVVVGPECGNPAIKQLVSLFPKGDFKFYFGTPTYTIPKDQFDSVLNGHLIYAYWGTICYRDAFNAVHYTNYCWSWSGKALTSENAEGCPQHNDSD